MNAIAIPVNSPEYWQLLKELAKNRQLWRLQNINNYQFTYQQQCFCVAPGNIPLKVAVKNDKITQVVDLKTNQTIPNLGFPKTIDQLFQILEKAIQSKADEISVTYDSTLGYPTKIAIDYQKILADEETNYLAKDLIKIK
ncbi:lipoprotein [Aphanothece sacrum FPU1]|uniref:Lipoprotein n=1 Tax=Aphanothece sacrum FPU1 TaxID=1920663 RepID=A0A401IG67_APHSA|nr:lipoprotein [Aphanothece sacrum FPU1]GBF83691.1 lipoprotein [Aphanothece sacrum FPU3]